MNTINFNNINLIIIFITYKYITITDYCVELMTMTCVLNTNILYLCMLFSYFIRIFNKMPKNCCVCEPRNILKPYFGVPKDEFKKKMFWEASLGMH